MTHNVHKRKKSSSQSRSRSRSHDRNHRTDDNKVRASWKMGAKCQIYSNSKNKWFYGEVAQIFTDEEGEWLEVRYDKSMSKQVQRYSTDIRPDPEELKKAKKSSKVSPRKGSKQSKEATAAEQQAAKEGGMPAGNQPYPDSEKQLRTSWGKGDQVEIFSNTHQEWYMGEVVDIIKDDEGEWLNCVWARTNGEAMSKQVQRLSADVRPVQGDDDDSGSDEVDSTGANTRSSASPRSTSGSPKNKSKKSKAQQMADQLKQRNENFRRRAPPFCAPPFSHTLRPSTFTFPATATAKRQRKLLDVEETNEKYQHVVDVMPRSNATVKRLDLASMKPRQVQDLIRSLGSAYEQYVSKFRRVKGSEFVALSEASMTKHTLDTLESQYVAPLCG